MPMLKRCCCTRNLRTGSILCGIWTLVWCVLSLSLNIVDLTDFYQDTEEFSQVKEMFAKYPHSQATLMWVILVISFTTFLSSVLEIAGVLKGSALLLIPWMISVMFLVLLDASSVIFNIIIGGFSQSHIVFLLLWIITTLLNIYCELCVLSHYQELKAGRGSVNDYLSGSSQGVRYVPAVQHIHIGDGPLNYIQSSHTVYSFHSQNLYDDESAVPVGVVYADQNGALEMAPVTSVPNMDHRSNGISGKDLRMVYSQPALFDRRYLNDSKQGGSSRIRTVSEGAIPEREEELMSVSREVECDGDTIPFSVGNNPVIEEE